MSPPQLLAAPPLLQQDLAAGFAPPFPDSEVFSPLVSVAFSDPQDFAASDEQQPFLSLLCFLSLSLSLSLSTETVSTLALKADAATATVPKEKVAKQRIANIFFIVLLF